MRGCPGQWKITHNYTNGLMKALIKFNNGNGAILCNKCHIIIKSNLTEPEWNGETDLLFCETCKPKDDESKTNI